MGKPYRAERASALQKRPDASVYLIFRQGPHCLVHDSTVPVKEHGWHPSYAVLRGCPWGAVHVDFGEFYLSLKDVCQFVQNRFEAAAVASPWCSEIDENRPLEVGHLPLEGGVRDLYGSPGIELLYVEGFLTSSAFHPVCPPALRNAVFGSALRTHGYDRLIVHGFLLGIL